MDAAPPLTRMLSISRFRPRLAIAAAGLFAVGVLAGLQMRRPPAGAAIVPIATPVHVSVAPSPAPSVTVEAPAPEAPPPAAPAVRAAAPRLWPECLALSMNEPPAAVCGWDEGFPAISADGKTLAAKVYADDAGRGNPGLSIVFLDAATARARRTVLVLSPDEYDDAPEALAKLRPRLARRAAAVQRELDAGGYRSLAPLGKSEDDGAPVWRDRFAAEISGGAVRVVDTVTSTAIWQHTFGVRGRVNEDADCGGWSLHGLEVWWDPEARLVLASLVYRTGGCMCSAVERFQVASMGR